MAGVHVWGLIGSSCMIWQEHIVLQEHIFLPYLDNLMSPGGYVSGRSKFFLPNLDNLLSTGGIF